MKINFFKHNFYLFILILINQFRNFFAYELINDSITTSSLLLNNNNNNNLNRLEQSDSLLHVNVLAIDNLNQNDLLNGIYNNNSLILNLNDSNFNLTQFINSSYIESDEPSLLRNIIISLIYIPIIVATLVGNMLVILAVVIVRKLHTQDNANNFLIVSLAISDFLVGVLVMPFAYYVDISHENKWYLGSILCDLWTMSDVLLCTASILNLCAISVDRYFIILHAMVYTQRRNAKLMLIMILVVWLTSALISIPPLFGWGKPSSRLEIDRTCAVSSDLKYQIYATLLSFYLPLIVMIIIYITIFRAAGKIKKRERETAGRLQYGMPSLQFMPESMTRSQIDPILNMQQSNNNFVYNNKTSANSETSILKNNSNSNNLINNNNNNNTTNNNNNNNNYSIKFNIPINNQVNQYENQEKTNPPPQQIIVTVKKTSSESEQGSTESKIYHSSVSSQENLNGFNKDHRLSVNANPIAMIVSSSTTQHGGSHVTINALNSSGSRRGSFGRKFGRRLTQAFSGIKRNSGASSSHGKNQKATRTLGVIMGCFILCWLPFFILALLKPIPLRNGLYVGDFIPKWLDSVLLWMGYFNSALNPMIYARFNQEFRRPFAEILCFRCKGINDRLRDEERRKMLFNPSQGHSSSTQLNHRPSNFNGVQAPPIQNIKYNDEKPYETNENVIRLENEDKLKEKESLIKKDELENPVLDMGTYKQQIEIEKNKFFFGTDKPPNLEETENKNLNNTNTKEVIVNLDKISETSKKITFEIDLSDKNITDKIDRNSSSSNSSSSRSRSSDKKINDQKLDDNNNNIFNDENEKEKLIVSDFTYYDASTNINHRISNDSTVTTESVDIEERRLLANDISNDTHENLKNNSNSLLDSMNSSDSTQFSSPVNSPVIEKNDLKSILQEISESKEIHLENNEQPAKSRVDIIKKLNNSSTKSSLLTNDSSNCYGSTSSIFQQVEQSITSILSSSQNKAVDNVSTNSKGSSLINNNCNNNNTNANITIFNNNSADKNGFISNNETVNSLKNKFKNVKTDSVETPGQFSSVYSFYTTAPTSPVNLTNNNSPAVLASNENTAISDDLSSIDSNNLNNINSNNDLLDLNGNNNNNNNSNEQIKTNNQISSTNETSTQRNLLNNNINASKFKTFEQNTENSSYKTPIVSSSSYLNQKRNQTNNNNIPVAYCTYNKNRRSPPSNTQNENVKRNKFFKTIISSKNSKLTDKNSTPNTLPINCDLDQDNSQKFINFHKQNETIDLESNNINNNNHSNNTNLCTTNNNKSTNLQVTNKNNLTHGSKTASETSV